MARIESNFDTALSPEGVAGALTDFSERRTQIWPYLAPEVFKVIELGASTALVREGSAKPFKVSAVERYDWSTPGVVRWKIESSDSFQPGTQLEAHISPGAGGGSKVHLVWERRGRSFTGKAIVGLLVLLRAKPIFTSYKKVFDGLAAKS